MYVSKRARNVSDISTYYNNIISFYWEIVKHLNIRFHRWENQTFCGGIIAQGYKQENDWCELKCHVTSITVSSTDIKTHFLFITTMSALKINVFYLTLS